MMNINKNAPIGVFDSGVGGLSCIPALRKALPGENFIYYGDTARAPYGSRPEAEIKAFSAEIAQLLLYKGCKALAIACNTISCVAGDSLRQQFPSVPIIGIVKPAAKKVAENFGGKRVGIIATPATVNSNAYPCSIHKEKTAVQVFSLAVPHFVEMVEEGNTSETADAEVKEALQDFVDKNRLDALVLGCTHFPHLKANIRRCFPKLILIDPAEALAGAVHESLKQRVLLCPEIKSKKREDIFLASRENEVFIKYVEPLLG